MIIVFMNHDWHQQFSENIKILTAKKKNLLQIKKNQLHC